MADIFLHLYMLYLAVMPGMHGIMFAQGPLPRSHLHQESLLEMLNKPTSKAYMVYELTSQLGSRVVTTPVLNGQLKGGTRSFPADVTQLLLSSTLLFRGLRPSFGK